MTQYKCLYLIFQGESEFGGLRGIKDYPEVLGERRDLHGHGLGQGVDQILLSAYNTCF